MGLFRETDSLVLKAWIVKRLENQSDSENDVDVDVLADYVLALLSQEGTLADIRALCEKELPELLQDKAPVIVADVFRAVEDETYLPEALRRPKPQPLPAQSIPSALTPATWPLQAPLPPNGSRKRSYYDASAADASLGQDHSYGRALKQPRRNGFGGRGGRLDDVNGFGMGQPPVGAPYGLSPDTSGVIPYDPGNPLNPFIQGLPKMPPPGVNATMFAYPAAPREPARRKRRVCRDFAAKGICTRPNCMFEHAFPTATGITHEPPFPATVPQPALEGYDPNNFSMGLENLPGHLPAQFTPVFTPFAAPQGTPKQKSRKGRAPFSADGPVHDRTKSTIVVENIPEETFTEEAVREFFAQFGNILEVSMQPYKRLALVKYDQWTSANAAYRSPKVMFDNRFVKVFWFKDETSTLPTSVTNGSRNGLSNGLKNGATMASDVSMGDATAGGEPEWDMEDFLRQQEKAQRLYDERKKKREELEQQRLEIEARQKELAVRQQEEKEKLRHILAASGDSVGDRSPSPEITFGTKPSKASEAIRAQLAALEAEAKQLGLDPDALDEPSFGWSPGGRGRGRGGYYRARGFAPRGFRGGLRGGRGAISAAIAAYSLDNRPKKVAILGVDFSLPEKDEVLRQYLLGIGDYTSIETMPNGAQVEFADRRTAEKLFYGLAGQAIPGLEGQPVDVVWVVGSVATAAATTAAPATAVKDFGAAAAIESSSVTTPKHDVNGDMLMAGGREADFEPENKAQMDFDVAGEPDWERL